MDSNIRFPVAEIVIEGSSANSSLRQSVTRRRRKYAQRGRFAPDSLLEGDGFEPSVPRRIFLAAPSIPQFTFRNINRLPRDRDRWFESISLQRGVSNEPVPAVVFA